MTQATGPQRLSFDEAAKRAQTGGGEAFAAAPVFADDGETAEGARVFIVEGDGAGSYQVRFIAGPFFSAAFAANEVLAAADVPERVRELQFLPTRFAPEWAGNQVQVLVSRLVQASGVSLPEMPDYLAAPQRAAAPEVRFPILDIGRAGATRPGNGD
jgi:hypothetical protein